VEIPEGLEELLELAKASVEFSELEVVEEVNTDYSLLLTFYNTYMNF